MVEKMALMHVSFTKYLGFPLPVVIPRAFQPVMYKKK
jgi:hypothetical protein